MQVQMRGFFAALRMTGAWSGFEREQTNAKAKANAGVLRCAQNDRRLGVGLNENRQMQRQMGFFAVLRMTQLLRWVDGEKKAEP
jgi:hypothetical protein